jgi:hypothetical protein
MLQKRSLHVLLGAGMFFQVASSFWKDGATLLAPEGVCTADTTKYLKI